MIQNTNRNISRRNKYILENILLNIFKYIILLLLHIKYYYIIKYIKYIILLYIKYYYIIKYI